MTNESTHSKTMPITLTREQAQAIREHYDKLKAGGYSGIESVAFIEDVLPEQETEHWKKIGSTIALYERWPLRWHEDSVWVARAKHIAKIAAEGTVPVNVLEKLCATWENEAKEAIVVVGVAKKRAINDLREVLAGREP